jgi:hypothetical protein
MSASRPRRPKTPPPRRPVRCPECPKQCFCGSSKGIQQNHLGGWHHVPWLFLPHCEKDHATFHDKCRQAGVDFGYTKNKSIRLIQALKAMVVGIWMVLEMFEKHLKDQS